MKTFLVLVTLVVNSICIAQQFTASAMAPLITGNIHFPNAQASEADWLKFEQEILEMKRLGATGISSDVWWGLVEKVEGKYNWEYYDKLFTIIRRAGLKWDANLSFHRCGGNVGDGDAYIPLPEWIWTKHIGKPGVTDVNSLKFKSEQGFYSDEFFSPSAIPIVLDDLGNFMAAFQDHYGPLAEQMGSVTISLGPAGELRFPAYNNHDIGAGYPTRGSLQIYSDLEIKAFQKAMLKKYGSLRGIKEAWGPHFYSIKSIKQIGPPNFNNHADYFKTKGTRKAERFFAIDEVHTPYGRDIFEFSNQQLYKTGYSVLKKWMETSKNTRNGAFKDVPVGAKLTGVHWRLADNRFAELASGVIVVPETPTPSDQLGEAYRPLLKLFQDLAHEKNAPPIELHFTCIELENGDNGSSAGSLAQSLVRSVIKVAKSMDITIKGENALEFTLTNAKAWDHIDEAIANGLSGINLLRARTVAAHELTRNRFKSITDKYCNTILDP